MRALIQSVASLSLVLGGGLSHAEGLGFPPEKACSYLSRIGIVPNKSGYTPFSSNSPNDYSCGTPYRDIGASTAGLPNNISYYVRGTKTSAKRLRVLVNVNQPTQIDGAKTRMAEAARELFRSAFQTDLPSDVAAAMTSGKPGKWKHQDFLIEFQMESWPTGRGLEFNFVIRDPAFSRAS